MRLRSGNRFGGFDGFRLRRFRARRSNRLRSAGSLKEIDRGITTINTATRIENRSSNEGKNNARANEDEEGNTFRGRFALLCFLLCRRLETVRTG